MQAAQAALDALRRIKPHNELEAMLAAQMISTHDAAMECLRRSMNGEQTFEGREHNLKHTAKLLQLYTRRLETLDKHGGKGQQKITVKHVTGKAGSEAIVGNVDAASVHRSNRAPIPAQLEHKQELDSRPPSPVSSDDADFMEIGRGSSKKKRSR